MDENGRDIEAMKSERDNYKSQLTTAQETLKSFEGVNVQELQGKITKLTADMAAKDAEHQKQIADRDYADAVNHAIADKGVKFSSKAAEKAFVADLTANRLTLKNGALEGFEDYLKAQQDSDPAAFQGDKPAPSFAKPVGPGGPPAHESKGAMYAKQFNQMYATQNTTKE